MYRGEVPFLIVYALAQSPEAMAGVPALGDPKTQLCILLLPPQSSQDVLGHLHRTSALGRQIRPQISSGTKIV